MQPAARMRWARELAGETGGCLFLAAAEKPAAWPAGDGLLAARAAA